MTPAPLLGIARIARIARPRARYLALVLPLFALFSTIQAGCSGSNKGGYYGASSSSSSSSSSGGPTGSNPGPDCTPYGPYSDCDDSGGYGHP